MPFRNRSTLFIFTGIAATIALMPLWHFYNVNSVTSIATHLVTEFKDNIPKKFGYADHPSEIPNLAHFVYVLEEPDSELKFHFSDFLSVYAAWYHWQPDAIYLHTNAPEETINRARDGRSGKWSRLIFDVPGFQVKYASVPTHAGNGMEINCVEHKTDFVRAQALRDYGGMYIDFDVHALRDIQLLRKTGFNAIGGREYGEKLCPGTFMAKKNSKVVNVWAEEMNLVYDGGWVTHANKALTRVAERLVAEPGEMLIMERNAFAPGSWEPEDCMDLFEVHDDMASNLDAIDSEGRLPSFDGNSSEIVPWWATDWSRTYLLHAFKPERTETEVYGFDQITPRYVFDRRSNFARAVYPIAKILHDRGLVEIDDSY